MMPLELRANSRLASPSGLQSKKFFPIHGPSAVAPAEINNLQVAGTVVHI
jgi:hypothetical protein